MTVTIDLPDEGPDPCAPVRVSQPVLLAEEIAQLRAQSRIISDILAERVNQDRKFGVQDIPSVPPGFDPLYALVPPQGKAKLLCDQVDRDGRLTSAHIILEEFAEFLDERDPVKRRQELVQLAACCVKALEAIDRGNP